MFELLSSGRIYLVCDALAALNEREKGVWPWWVIPPRNQPAPHFKCCTRKKRLKHLYLLSASLAAGLGLHPVPHGGEVWRCALSLESSQGLICPSLEKTQSQGLSWRFYLRLVDFDVFLEHNLCPDFSVISIQSWCKYPFTLQSLPPSQSHRGPAHSLWLEFSAWATVAEMPFTPPGVQINHAGSFYQQHHISHLESQVSPGERTCGHWERGHSKAGRGRWCTRVLPVKNDILYSGQKWPIFLPLLETEASFLSPAMTSAHVTFNRENRNCINLFPEQEISQGYIEMAGVCQCWVHKENRSIRASWFTYF